jgi:hypothetical protein
LPQERAVCRVLQKERILVTNAEAPRSSRHVNAAIGGSSNPLCAVSVKPAPRPFLLELERVDGESVQNEWQSGDEQLGCPALKCKHSVYFG